MVSFRCKMAVKTALDSLGLKHGTVDLGEVEVLEPLTADQIAKLRHLLRLTGLELMENKKAVLIEKIKNVIIEMVYQADELPKLKYSEYLSKKLHHNYTFLSTLFSETTGITIEQYIIATKIEKVKELLLHHNLTLNEISYKLHYSSVAHLSKQFKKVTGFTPSYYKKLKESSKPISDDM